MHIVHHNKVTPPPATVSSFDTFFDCSLERTLRITYGDRFSGTMAPIIIRRDLPFVLDALDGYVYGKRILDLGCGSIESEEYVLPSRDNDGTHDPWIARALTEMGAEVVGIDMAKVYDEPFEGHTIDLMQPGALDGFSGAHFDLVRAGRLFESFALIRKYPKTYKSLPGLLESQVERVLKLGGTYIISP